MQSIHFLKYYKSFFITIGVLQLVALISVVFIFKCNLLLLSMSKGFCLNSVLLIFFGLASIVFPFVIVSLALSKDTLGKIKRRMSSIWAASFCAFLLIMLIMVTFSKDRIERIKMTSYELASDTLYIDMADNANSFLESSINLGNMKAYKDSLGLHYNGVSLVKKPSSDNLLHIERKVVSRGLNKIDAQASSRTAINHFNFWKNRIKINPFIMIPKKENFQYQKIQYTIYVPDGKTVIES